MADFRIFIHSFHLRHSLSLSRSFLFWSIVFLPFSHCKYVVWNQRDERRYPGGRIRQTHTDKTGASRYQHDNSASGHKLKHTAEHGHKAISHSLKCISVKEDTPEERIAPENRVEIHH